MAELSAEQTGPQEEAKIETNLEQARVVLSQLTSRVQDNPRQVARCQRLSRILTQIVERYEARKASPALLRSGYDELFSQSLVPGIVKDLRSEEQSLLAERQSAQRGAEFRFWAFSVFVLLLNLAMLWWAVAGLRNWTEEKEATEAAVRSLNKRLGDQVNDTRKLNVSLEQRVFEKTKELERTISELQASNAELERFTYVAAHDLQEPLRQVVSFGELLSSKYPDHLDETARRYLSYSVDGAKRLQSMLAGLLQYTMVTPSAIQPVEFRVGGMVESVLQELKDDMDGAVVEVLGAEDFSAFADPAFTRIVLSALLSNAIKFRRQNVVPRITLEFEKRNGSWSMSVTDNGIGIDQGFTPRVFQMFARLHPVGRYPGTGVGLALSKRIAECHGGSMILDQHPNGAGSRFVVTLPFRDAQAATHVREL